MATLLLLFMQFTYAQTHVNSGQLSGTLAAGEYFNSSGITLKAPFNFTSAMGKSLRIYIGSQSTIPSVPLEARPSSAQNYILTYTPRIAGFTNSTQLSADTTSSRSAMIAIEYFDGLGRPFQTVQVKGSPTHRDVVQPIAYDEFGREPLKYLPYTVQASAASVGSYQATAVADELSFYAGPTDVGWSAPGVVGTTKPFSLTIFERSPLNRVVEQGSPGEAWQPKIDTTTGHTVKIEYGTNQATGDFSVRAFSAVSGILSNPNNPTTNSGFYSAGKLHLTITKDESWDPKRDEFAGQSHEYKDEDGKLLLKRVFCRKGSTLESYSTYYVYDDFGNLSFVLPPGADADTGVPDVSKLASYCYQYKYDERNRLVEKKIPGKDWEYLIYNQLDQIVLSQDGEQRKINQWMVSKYDVKGRAIIIGLWNAGSQLSRSTLISNIYSAKQSDIRDESKNVTTNPTGYIVESYPQNLSTILNINYYDDYDFPGAIPPPSSQAYTVIGRLTGTKVNVLGTTKMLLTVNYFDNKGNVLQTIGENHLDGTDQITNSYSFTNELLSSKRTHIANGRTTDIVLNYTYDHVGRKVETTESINGAATSLSKLIYNEVGQLKDKALGSGLQTLSYTYNERGWMRTISTSANLFSLDLRYNTPDAAANAQWNGNISQMNYLTKKVSNPGIKTFSYTYDKLNRLTDAVSTANALDESISYDRMGNITKLIRGGAGQGTLDYTYNGNQLTKVEGYSTRNYQYDLNGNATSDGMGKAITYNMLNLPSEVKQTVSGKITTLATYTYNAAGQKLQNKGTDGQWDYVGGIVYKDSQIAFIQTEEGKAKPRATDGVYLYEYNLNDHLGNTRVSIDKDPTATSTTPRIIQEDEYYSFGLRKPAGGFDYSNNNRYLYNGKEVQTDLATKYDYGARFYDPVISRFFTVDTKSEQSRRYSNYSYAINNPIRFIDIDGEGPGDRVKAARQMVGAEYVQEAGGLRTGTYAKALLNKDCSEFVNRVLAADGITDGVSSMNTAGMKSYFNDESKFVHSKSPQPGDIALWNGHVGIVSAVDKEGRIKLIHARGEGKLSAENKNFARSDQYRDSEFYGYYRPKEETPDGKDLNKSLLSAGAEIGGSKRKATERSKEYKHSKRDFDSGPEWLKFQLKLLHIRIIADSLQELEKKSIDTKNLNDNLNYKY